MKWFDYAAPRSVYEAVGLLAAHPGARLLAGGTDLLVQLRAGRKETDLVVDLKRIPELNAIEYDPQRGLTLGAAVPCYRIYGDSRRYASLPGAGRRGLADRRHADSGAGVDRRQPVQRRAQRRFHTAADRSVAPPAASPGPAEPREIAVEDFCTAPGRNVLAAGRTAGLAPSAAARAALRRALSALHSAQRNGYRGGRARAWKWSLENGTFRSARIALASVAPTPLFVREAGEALAGKPVNEPRVSRPPPSAPAGAAKPITDMRGTAEYRRHLCAVLTRRALEAAVQRAREAK